MQIALLTFQLLHPHSFLYGLPFTIQNMGLLFVTLLALSASFAWGANFETRPPYTAQLYASGVSKVRGLYLDDAGDLLAVAENLRQILAFWTTSNPDGSETVHRAVIVDANGLSLNHGITFSNGYLYASSPTTVYRWPYTPGQRTQISEAPVTVVNNIPSGGHTTRTLAVDKEERLYVSVGSGQNIDQDSTRARIRRFPIPSAAFPFNFANAEVFADGLRNEVGITFDSYGVLWGVENCGDMLNRPDLGGDIHNGNPSEELNRFGEAPGSYYGYPFCFSTYNLPGYDAGTQFAWPSFMGDGIHSDDWCRRRANNVPPALPLPAHTAPLGIEFLSHDKCDTGVPGSFPCSMAGDAFVANHGSWNSDNKVGYSVIHIPINAATLLPTGTVNDVMVEPNLSGCGASCLRPVNAVFNKQGHLIVSADTSNELFRIVYDATPPPITQE